jgi:phage terminase small subunit
MDDTALTTTDDRLTDKQRLFAAYYLGEARGNATKAARLAGYQGSDHVLHQIGYENLRKPEIHAVIHQRLDEIGMTQGEILAELADIARADWQHFIEVKRNHKGEVIESKIVLRDKLMALELLARCHGMLTDNVKHSGVIEAQVRQIVVHCPPGTIPTIP